MKSSKDQLIVLTAIRYKDQNWVVKALTPDRGIIPLFLTPSSKNTKGKGKQNFQPFALLEVISSQRSAQSMANIQEAKVQHLLVDIRTNIHKNGMSLLLAEVLTKAIGEDHADPSLFSFVRSSILELELEHRSYANYHLYFIAQLSKYLGIQPQVRENARFFDLKEGVFDSSKPMHPHFISSEESMLLAKFFTQPWAECQTIALSGKKRNELLQELLKFYQYHIANFEIPKSLAVLAEVFG